MSGSDSQLSKDGFSNWKHPERLEEHEVSKDHLDSVIKFVAVQNDLGRIDKDLVLQAKQAETYWKSVLKRVISVLKFICERGLAISAGLFIL